MIFCHLHSDLDGQDLLKYSMDEIVAACQAKWHPNLNKAFVEAGVPISLGKVQGDDDSILAALKKNGQKKLVMIVRTLAGILVGLNWGAGGMEGLHNLGIWGTSHPLLSVTLSNCQGVLHILM